MRAFRLALAFRHRCTTLIQRLWRRFKMARLVPRAIKAKKETSAVLIQRLIKGYM